MSSVFPDPSTPLFPEEISRAVRLLLGADSPDAEKGEFLSSLHRRGETAEELSGFALEILKGAVPVEIERDPARPLVELCGTGGDRAGFLNISTAAMFVAAGAGARVVKHGNRAFTSRSGSADVLGELGVSIHLDPARVGEVLECAGSVFLLASDFHPAFAAVAPLRRELADRGQLTIFNLLGPLLNPARPEVQLTGIYRPEMLDFYASALHLLGRRAAWAVHGEGLRAGEGVDELSVTGPSRVVAIREGIREMLMIEPSKLGFPPVREPELLLGGDASANARRITAILSSAEQGPARDMIVLNAAAALHIAGFADDLPGAILLAKESIDSGKAARSLELLRDASAKAARRI